MYAEVGNLNPYALDYPVCVEDGSNAGRARKYGRSQRTWLMNFALPTLFTELLKTDERNPRLSATSELRLAEIRKSIGLQSTDEFVPCAEDYMTSYLNQDSVKQAIHVKSDIVWKDCSTIIR